jgi:hypothetical protein
MIFRFILFTIRNVSDKSCREDKIKTPILCSITPTPLLGKPWLLKNNVEKYCRAEDTTQDNTAHALCVLDN